MSVLFHGNFGLNREYMSGLLALAINNPKFKDKNLAQPFGYGAPFGQRYRSWLHKTGMTKMGLPIELTPMGEVVYKNDPKFETLSTQWFLHHELVTDPERSEAWHYFAVEFLPKYPSFTEKELLEGLTQKLRPHSEQHFGPGSKLNQQILRKIIQVYTEDSGLGKLGLIKKEGDRLLRLKPKKIGPWKSPVELAASY
jgi:hypothetical protein